MVDKPQIHFNDSDYYFIKTIKHFDNNGKYLGRGRIYEIKSIPRRYAISMLYTGGNLTIDDIEKITGKDYIYGQFLTVEEAEKVIVKIFKTWQ